VVWSHKGILAPKNRAETIEYLAVAAAKSLVRVVVSGAFVTRQPIRSLQMACPLHDELTTHQAAENQWQKDRVPCIAVIDPTKYFRGLSGKVILNDPVEQTTGFFLWVGYGFGELWELNPINATCSTCAYKQLHEQHEGVSAANEHHSKKKGGVARFPSTCVPLLFLHARSGRKYQTWQHGRSCLVCA